MLDRAKASISFIYPKLRQEHFLGVEAIFTHSSIIYSPIFIALLLYPTNIEAAFTTEPGVMGDVNIAGV